MPAQVAVVAAAHDLAAGRVLRIGDLRLEQWPAGVAPPAALHLVKQVAGQVLAAAVTTGEPMTPARLRGRGLTAGLAPGTVATTVLVSDAAALSLIQPGELVDLIVTDSPDAQRAHAHVAARAVRVLAVLNSAPDAGLSNGTGSNDASSSLVVAANETTALTLAAAAGQPITATLRTPP